MDLAIAERNPEEVAPEEIPSVIGRLEALKTRLKARLFRFNDNSPGEQKPSNGDDRWLTAEQVAELLHVDIRWVYRQTGKWTFARRLSPRKILFSEAGLRKWMESRPNAAT